MYAPGYPLIPFTPLPQGNLQLHGAARRDAGALYLEFVLAGDLACVELAAPCPVPSRADGLWRTTCFECFFRLAGMPGYYEVNLATSGDWNYYRFAAYRQGMREVETGAAILTSSECHGGTLFMSGRIPLEAGSSTAIPMELALCSVLAHGNGELSYWALVHPDEKPDFHHPEGFVVKLE